MLARRAVNLYQTAHFGGVSSDSKYTYLHVSFIRRYSNGPDPRDVLVDLIPKITVCGLGGAGGNTVNNMINKQFSGVDFLVANTDAQALAGSVSTKRVQLGRSVTRGLGAGAKPSVGRLSAEESLEEVLNDIGSSHMVFITAGMGGGTGTGSAPVIANAAKSKGILTVGIVTKPFHFEGKVRMRLAEEGLAELEKCVDTLIVIPNQKLLELDNKQLPFSEAFAMVDDVLYHGIKGVTDVLVKPGLINLDFADVRTIMTDMGRSLMGTGEAEGRGRAKSAAEQALHNPLLEDVQIRGAKGVLINVASDGDATLLEVQEIASTVSSAVDAEANIIFGSSIDPELHGKIRVTLIVTGMSKNDQLGKPATLPGQPQHIPQQSSHSSTPPLQQPYQGSSHQQQHQYPQQHAPAQSQSQPLSSPAWSTAHNSYAQYPQTHQPPQPSQTQNVSPQDSSVKGIFRKWW